MQGSHLPQREVKLIADVLLCQPITQACPARDLGLDAWPRDDASALVTVLAYFVSPLGDFVHRRLRQATALQRVADMSGVHLQRERGFDDRHVRGAPPLFNNHQIAHTRANDLLPPLRHENKFFIRRVEVVLDGGERTAELSGCLVAKVAAPQLPSDVPDADDG